MWGETITLADYDMGSGAGGDLGGLLTSDDGLSLLPVLRWADVAGGLTSRVDGWDNFNPLTWFGAIPNTLSGAFLSLGNNLWATAAWFQEAASGADIVGTVGPIANKFMSAMYTGLTSDWIVFTIPAIIAIIAGLWAAVRGRGMKELCRRAGALTMGLTLFVTMGATSAANPDTAAAGTPYWMVRTASSIIGNAGGGIADSLLNGSVLESDMFLASKADSVTNLSCRRYLAQLGQDYADGSNLATSANPVLTSLNRMWEETGLRIWSRQQYGPGENASQVFCRVLEARAGASPKTMFTTTNTASGNLLGDDGSDGWLGVAWWPNLMSIKDLDDDKEQPDETTDKKLDRIAVLFEVCEIDGDGAFQTRPGWDWVDALSEGGSHRGLDKDNHTPTDECQAALTAHYNGGNYTVGDANGDNVKISEERFNGDINDIVRKFDIRTDGDWQAKTQQNTADLNAANQAVVTVNQQHGTASMGDVGAAVVFTLSGLVNLVIWGVILGLMRIACLFVACFLACAGVGLGALVLAFAPDKGRRALLNAFGRMVGMCAGVTVVGLVAAVGCIFFNAGMAVLGLLDNDGNTTGTVLSMSLASILLPLGYLWMVRYLCVNVWRIGDPFSARALGSIMGGRAVLGGLKTLGVAALAGGAAAVAGGGLAGALSAAGRGLSSGGRGGLVGGVLQGMDTGRREAFYNRLGSGRHANGGPVESGADAAARRAAGDNAPTSDGKPGEGAPSAARQEYLRQATERRRAQLVEEYKAAGLTGDALDAAVDKALASGNVGEQVAGMADALAAASPLDAYRANADPASDGMLADMGAGLVAWGGDRVRRWAAPVAAGASALWTGVQRRAPGLADNAVRLGDLAGRSVALVAPAVNRGANAVGRFVSDTAAPAAAGLASGAARTLAAHPRLATAAMIGTGLALPMTTPLMMAGLGGTLAAHTALNANGLANRGYHAVADGFASSRASAVARTAGVEKGAPALAAAHDAIADRYAASPFASREYRERVEARHAEQARDRVYDDQAVNGMAMSGMQARLDELLYQGLPGEQAPAARYLKEHPDSMLAKDMQAGDEMYREFVEQGGQETDGAMRDAPYMLGHGTNAAQATGRGAFSWTPDKTRNGGSSMPGADAHRSGA